jgi:hypothetical protein
MNPERLSGSQFCILNFECKIAIRFPTHCQGKNVLNR